MKGQVIERRTYEWDNARHGKVRIGNKFWMFEAGYLAHYEVLSETKARVVLPHIHNRVVNITRGDIFARDKRFALVTKDIKEDPRDDGDHVGTSQPVSHRQTGLMTIPYDEQTRLIDVLSPELSQRIMREGVVFKMIDHETRPEHVDNEPTLTKPEEPKDKKEGTDEGGEDEKPENPDPPSQGITSGPTGNMGEH